METNSRFIKFSGKAEIPEDLEMGRNYKIEIDASVTSISEHDNHNGTKDIAFKVEPVLATILKDNGETIKVKDTRKESQKLRGKLYMVWQSNNDSRLFEDFYNKFLMGIRLDADELSEKYGK